MRGSLPCTIALTLILFLAAQCWGKEKDWDQLFECGLTAIQQRDFETAETSIAESLQVAQQTADFAQVEISWELLSWVYQLQGESEKEESRKEQLLAGLHKLAASYKKNELVEKVKAIEPAIKSIETQFVTYVQTAALLQFCSLSSFSPSPAGVGSFITKIPISYSSKNKQSGSRLTPKELPVESGTKTGQQPPSNNPAVIADSIPKLQTNQSLYGSRIDVPISIKVPTKPDTSSNTQAKRDDRVVRVNVSTKTKQPPSIINRTANVDSVPKLQIESQYCIQAKAAIVKQLNGKLPTKGSIVVTFLVDSAGKIADLRVLNGGPGGCTLDELSALGKALRTIDTLPMPPNNCTKPLKMRLKLAHDVVETTLGVDLDLSKYIQQTQARIKSLWHPPRDLRSHRVVVIYKVWRDGRISDVTLDLSSGNKAHDEYTLGCVRSASPLEALPDGAPDYVDVQFTFDYNVFNGGRNPLARSGVTSLESAQLGLLLLRFKTLVLSRKYEEAEPVANKLLVDAEKVAGDQGGILSLCQFSVADFYGRTGRLSKCEDLLHLALVSAQKNESQKPLQIEIWEILAAIETGRENYKGAKDFLDKAEAVNETIVPKSNVRTAKLLGVRGQILAAQMEVQLALKEYERGLNLLYEKGNDSPRAALMHGMSRVYAQIGEIDKAYSMNKEALRLAEQSTDPFNPSVCAYLTDLADLAIRQKNWSEAAGYIQSAIQIERSHYTKPTERLTKLQALSEIVNAHIKEASKPAAH